VFCPNKSNLGETTDEEFYFDPSRDVPCGPDADCIERLQYGHGMRLRLRLCYRVHLLRSRALLRMPSAGTLRGV
jgi:hypothetical protein